MAYVPKPKIDVAGHTTDELEALAEIAELSQQLGGKYQLVEVVDEEEP